MKIYEYVIKNPKITSPYGYRIHPIYKTKKFHYGLDLISKAGDRNYYAIDDGYVQKVVTGQDKSKTGYGNYIWVRFPRYDLSLLFAHCSKIYLKRGDKVSKGTKIAYMGHTGAATGDHLHLGMTRIGSNTWLNPANYDMLDDSGKYNLTRLLKKGCKGNDVRELQRELIKHGYSVGRCGVDGVFGKDTFAAVKKFQNDQHIASDGVVGINTAHRLGWLYKNK